MRRVYEHNWAVRGGAVLLSGGLLAAMITSCGEARSAPAQCSELTVQSLGQRTVEATVAFTTENGAQVEAVDYRFTDHGNPVSTPPGDPQSPVLYEYPGSDPVHSDITATLEVVLPHEASPVTVTSDSCDVSFAVGG